VDTGRVWLITGASSGFGLAVAEAALARGDSVVATSRSVESIELEADDRVAHVALDVTDEAQNNAGRTQVGAVEETTDQELCDLLELHFVAPAARRFRRRSLRSASGP